MTRVLLLADAPRAVFENVASATAALRDFELLPLTPMTENALRQRIAAGGLNAVHFIGRAQARAAARFCSIMLQGSDGRERAVTAQQFANACAGLRLVVLQAVDDASYCFDTASDALLAAGVSAVVLARPMHGDTQRIFAAKLYSGVVAGLTLAELEAQVSAAVKGVQFAGSDPARKFAAAAPATVEKPPAAEPAPKTRRDEAERRRAAGQFDVFLCHSWADKPAVRRLAKRLLDAGVVPWLDEWELPPGLPWQPLLEEQIGNIRSAAVCVGASGLGPWQEEEMYAFLREFRSRRCPVIPVLLEDAPKEPDIPIFLGARTWVDFRVQEPDPLERLIWGITGQKPVLS